MQMKKHEDQHLARSLMVGLCHALGSVTKGHLRNCVSLLPCSLQCWQLHDWPLPMPTSVAAQPEKEGVTGGDKLELLPRKAVWSSTGSLYDPAVRVFLFRNV